MNRYYGIVLGILLCFNPGQLWASEAEEVDEELIAEELIAEEAEYVNPLLHNQYLLENIRLLGLAQERFAGGQFEEAIQYAEEANTYAQLSDDYVALQMLIKETNDAIAAAESRIDWAKRYGIPRGYPEVYGEAEAALTESLDARSNEAWKESLAAAQQVIALLSELPDEPVLAAQYLVRNWNPMRDCLWNIAGMPEIYGDPKQWRRIYNANKSKLPNPNNPNLLRPGTVLDIPNIGDETRIGRLEN